MSYEYDSVILKEASPRVLNELNKVSRVVFEREADYDLRDHRPDTTLYVFATPRDTNEVVAMGGVAPFENFAGTGLDARYFCDLAVLEAYRGQGVARSVVQRRVDKVMAELSPKPRILVADLAVANARKTSGFLNSALDKYQERVISDPSEDTVLRKVLRSKTQLGPDGDGNVIILNSASETVTHITHYSIPHIQDFEATRKALLQTIATEPERNDAWIVIPGHHVKDFCAALNLDQLPEPRFQSDRFARIILPE